MKALTNGSHWPSLDGGPRSSTAADGRPPATAEIEQRRIAAVGASSGGAVRETRLGLPMPTLDVPTVADDYCVVTPVDRNGRLASRSFLTFVGWDAGQPVTWSVAPGPIAVVVAGGEGRLDPRGHLVLPLPVRRRCRIVSRDHVLVLADRARANLLVIPTALVRHLLSGSTEGAVDE